MTVNDLHIHPAPQHLLLIQVRVFHLKENMYLTLVLIQIMDVERLLLIKILT